MICISCGKQGQGMGLEQLCFQCAVLRAQPKAKARRAQRVGSNSQDVAHQRLIYLGFQMVIKISTPMAKIRGKWMHSGKAEGDLRAIGPGGTSVLAEVKWRPETLIFSDLEKHQVYRLDQHRALGGISLLIWHKPGKMYVVCWDTLRKVGFGPGESLEESFCELHQFKRQQLPRGPLGDNG